MNYAVVILAFVFVFATVLWFVWGRRIYEGPVCEIIVEPFFEEKFRASHNESIGKV
jgi:hypothetical protein